MRLPIGQHCCSTISNTHTHTKKKAISLKSVRPSSLFATPSTLSGSLKLLSKPARTFVQHALGIAVSPASLEAYDIIMIS